MSSWIALHNNEMTRMLLERYPNAFLLLTQIGLRAWWKRDEKSPVGLEYGQAFIGDFRSIGLTEKGYRVAKRRLSKNGLVSFAGANKGTVATLLDCSVYSITKSDKIDQNRGGLGASEGQAKGGQRGGLGADNETHGSLIDTSDPNCIPMLEGGLRADSGAGEGQARGGERATNSHTHTQAQSHTKKPSVVWTPDDTQTKINQCYKRRASTKWSPAELKAYSRIEIIAEDVDLICRYCDPVSGCQYRRTDIKTLLNNWQGELDRARGWESNPKPAQQSFTEINAAAKSSQFSKNLSNPLY